MTLPAGFFSGQPTPFLMHSMPDIHWICATDGIARKTAAAIGKAILVV
ncbi:MAG: hypothetical protein JF615_16690 [Asticcacaulis sp.]|nr:hypothetical protein [Asticcacaulis sp.]